MKDRLIEIITNKARELCLHCDECGGLAGSNSKMDIEQIAQALLDNGVIVPKFKIGQIVWRCDALLNMVTEEVVQSIEGSSYWDGIAYLLSSVQSTSVQRFKESVIYATKEEAEAALKEMEEK